MYIKTDMHQFYNTLTVTDGKDPYQKSLSIFRLWKINSPTVLQSLLAQWGWRPW